MMSLNPTEPSEPPPPDPHSVPSPEEHRTTRFHHIGPYVRLARPDHWFKNVFMVPGILLAFFFDRTLEWTPAAGGIVLGFAAACLIASSNYVLNEILDARFDKYHPKKHVRPLVNGTARVSIAWGVWIVLGLAGIALGFLIDPRFAASGIALWVMGLLYNVPPIRLKDRRYSDVLSESINNPIRLALGWYATGVGAMPPLSIILAYWMFGSFLMGAKRFAEFRHINDPDRASLYRKSFAWYDEERLIVSLFFYAAAFALMSGFFIARYRFELILAAPVLAYAMAYYMHMAYKPDSPVQAPEKLHSQKKFMLILTVAVLLCAVLLFVDLPDLRHVFDPWIDPPAYP